MLLSVPTPQLLQADPFIQFCRALGPCGGPWSFLGHIFAKPSAEGRTTTLPPDRQQPRRATAVPRAPRVACRNTLCIVRAGGRDGLHFASCAPVSNLLYDRLGSARSCYVFLCFEVAALFSESQIPRVGAACLSLGAVPLTSRKNMGDVNYLPILRRCLTRPGYDLHAPAYYWTPTVHVVDK